MGEVLPVAVRNCANFSVDLPQVFLVGIDELGEVLVHKGQQVVAECLSHLGSQP